MKLNLYNFSILLSSALSLLFLQNNKAQGIEAYILGNYTSIYTHEIAEFGFTQELTESPSNIGAGNEGYTEVFAKLTGDQSFRVFIGTEELTSNADGFSTERGSFVVNFSEIFENPQFQNLPIGQNYTAEISTLYEYYEYTFDALGNPLPDPYNVSSPSMNAQVHFTIRSQDNEHINTYFDTRLSYVDCNTAILKTRSDLRPNERWYWQTSPTGQSTSLEVPHNANAPHTEVTVHESGSYYLRRVLEQANGTSLWSPPYEVVVDLESQVFSFSTDWYIDTDGDGYGDKDATALRICVPPVGYVDNNLDQCPTVAGENAGCAAQLSERPILDDAYNYVHSISPLVPLQNIEDFTHRDQAIENVNYTDGFGRSLKNIAIGQSPQGYDIVQIQVYDTVGRQPKQYLPYVRKQNTGQFSVLEEDLDKDYFISKFYQDNNPEEMQYINHRNELNPYSETTYDSRGRVTKVAAPGNPWKKESGHEVKTDYEFNTTTDQVYQLHATYTNNHFIAPSLQVNNFYEPNKLYKTILTDEHGITTETYTDFAGKTILTRKEGLDTYTVYDDYGNVIYVIPPKVTLNNGISTTELNELCYQYIYNTTGQLLESKEPSKGWQYTVYNNLGQPILVQSALLKETNQWLFTKYDYFGRVTYTGLYTDARSREVIQEERYGVAYD